MTVNLDPLRSARVVRGAQAPNRAASTGLDVSDGTTEVSKAQELLFLGGTVTELDEGIAQITVGGGPGSGSGATAIVMLNNSGQELPVGSAVVVDDTADRAVTVTTDPASTLIAGIVQENIPNGDSGLVLFNGYAADVITTGDVARGQYAQTSAVAGAAQATDSREAGSFGVFLTGLGVEDFVSDSAVTEQATSGTSLVITMPATVEAGRLLFMSLWFGSSVTGVTLTGWTLIGSTAGFYYFYKIASGSDAPTATWTGSTTAVATVLMLSEQVDIADPVEAFAYDATTAAAALSGMSAAPRYAVAAVQTDEWTSHAGWTDLVSGSAAPGAAGTPFTGSLTTTSPAPDHPVWTNDLYLLGPGTMPYIPDASDTLVTRTISDLHYGDRLRFYVITNGGARRYTDTNYFNWSYNSTNKLWYLVYEDGGGGARPPSMTPGGGGDVFATLDLGDRDVTDIWIENGYGADAGGALIGQYIGTSATATSPYTGAAEQNDAIFAFNLTTFPTPSLLLYGPDLGGTGVAEPIVYLTRDTGERHVPETITAGSAETLDLETANTFDVTMTDDLTITLSNPPDSGVEGRWTIVLRQDGTGGWTVTWPASVVWRDTDGTQTTTAPTLATAAGAVDTIDIRTLDGGATYGASLENGSNGATGGASVLDDLTDVTLTAPAADDTLRYVGGVWVNDNRRWEPVTTNPGTGPELVWDGDEIVMNWATY